MTWDQAETIFWDEIRRIEREAYESDCESMGVLAAQDAWQGLDNGIQSYPWPEWLDHQAPHFDPDDYEDGTTDRQGCLEHFAGKQCRGEIGTGEPLGVVGDGFALVYTLVCDSADEESLRSLARSYLQSNDVGE